MALANDAARQKDQEVNCEITQHQQGYGASRQHSRAERYDSQHFGQRGFIDIVGLFEWVVGSTRLIDRHGSHLQLWATIDQLCPSPARIRTSAEEVETRIHEVSQLIGRVDRIGARTNNHTADKADDALTKIKRDRPETSPSRVLASQELEGVI